MTIHSLLRGLHSLNITKAMQVFICPDCFTVMTHLNVSQCYNCQNRPMTVALGKYIKLFSKYIKTLDKFSPHIKIAVDKDMDWSETFKQVQQPIIEGEIEEGPPWEEPVMTKMTLIKRINTFRGKIPETPVKSMPHVGQFQGMYDEAID